MINNNIKDVVIIGSGPAALTCSIYLSRAGFSPIIIAGNNPGGQLMNTDLVENYPGFISIKGQDLMMNMISHSQDLGPEFIYENVESLKINNKIFEIKLSSDEIINAKSVVIATGASHKKLNIKGENEFTNKGVSWCATCDGPMYRGKKVAVIGGGNTAIMESIFLSNFSDEVLLIHRRNSLRADKIMQDKLFANTKIKCIWDSEVVEFIGSNQSLEEIKIKNNIDNSISYEKIDGVFIAIGTKPSTDFIRDSLVDLDEDKYIICNETKTKCRGLFAAGDVVSKSLKQAIFAAGQGALASKQVENYLLLDEF